MATTKIDDYAALANSISELADGGGVMELEFWSYAAVASCMCARIDGGFNAEALSDAAITVSSGMFGKLMDRINLKTPTVSSVQRERALDHFDGMLRTALEIHADIANEHDCDFGLTYQRVKHSPLSKIIDDDAILLRCAMASDMALCKIIWEIELSEKYQILIT